MMEADALSGWWGARTERERRLLLGAAILIFAVLAPVWAYLAASDFREDAAADLASARQIEAQVAQLSRAGEAGSEAPASSDPSLTGRIQAAAQAAGLQPSRIESAGAGVRVSFEAADSVAVYRWLALVASGGAQVTRTAIVRVADSEQVTAEFEVTEQP